ncbi:MAG: extracellular solute-binding protein [Bacillota bacterium]
MNSCKKRFLIVPAAVVLILLILSVFRSEQMPDVSFYAASDFKAETDLYDKSGYEQYLAMHSDAVKPGRTIRIEGEEYVDATGGQFEIAKQYMGLDGTAVLTPETGTISWTAEIEEPGLYNMKVHYYPVEGKSSAIERSLSIDDETPFTGAKLLLFERIWGDREEGFIRDDRGNDLRPRQIEKPRWETAWVKDSEYFNEEPYLFYFDKGVHTISLTALREPMAIDYIELCQDEEVKTYDQMKKIYEETGLKPVENQCVIIQAEAAASKSSPTLYAISDRSSPLVVPYHVSKIRMNAIGGYNWRLPGQWIEWEIEVPETGLYQVALKRKQDQLRGIFATRSLTIDGRYPFQEMKRIRFYYDPDWQMDILGDEEPYLFYLEKGTHRLRLTATLREIAPLIQTMQSSILKLNEMYRKILMITSVNPDPFRDYQLEKRIPGMTEVFREQAEIIQSVADYLVQVTGEKSDKVAPLHSIVIQLKDMAERPETVARRLNEFKVNVGGLGTWILSVKEQPLTLDYLVVSTPGCNLPEAEASFLQGVRHELGSYIASFTEDYDSIGNIADKGQVITVWIATGRDQAQTLKAMIDDVFTPDTNIGVRLRIVPPNILLPATLAGEGPDIAMQVGEDVPVNYAMRNAAIELSQFPDFEQVAARFRESALTPYRFNGGVYALPEQQSFPVLFYRKDVLEELGLTPPRTWDDVYNMIPVLQKHNLEFYLPLETTLNNANLVPNATFAMLLYQNGGEFYTEDQKRSALDSVISIEVFREWSRFYTNYKFPLQADFVNRFRTGEMPIGIANYTTYNMLVVFAPEIKGLWDFTIVPGTVRQDGSIRHDVASSTSAVIMLKNAKNPGAAWEFMKWWTDKETQIRYGREMEALMGESARYPTANVEALEELPWPVETYKKLSEQWKWVKGIPQVPGGYFTGRHLDNAFRKVVNSGENYREALLDYVIYINDEIRLKRQEFNLPY